MISLWKQDILRRATLYGCALTTFVVIYFAIDFAVQQIIPGESAGDAVAGIVGVLGFPYL